MAFPTSSLTNNQVHKEGNRAFVYDSAIGVWDQVRETDRTENKILSGEIGGGTIGSGVAFPAGMVRQVKQGSWGSLAQGTGARQCPNYISFSTAKLATSHVLIHYYFSFIPRGSTAQGTNNYGTAWLTGSNFGSTTSGLLIHSYIAYYQDTFHDRHTKSGSVLDTNPTAAPAYGLHVSCEGAAFQLGANENPIGATLYEILV